MPLETLESLRLLSNLETEKRKLLQIVLFGQPELDDRLAETGMRQLKERITHNFALESLQRNDVGTYLMFRLRTAGYRGPDLFTPKAIQRISQVSEGLTRRINILADKALLSAFSENRYQIDTREVDAAIRDAQFKPMQDLQLNVGVFNLFDKEYVSYESTTGLSATTDTSNQTEPGRNLSARVQYVF